MLDFIDSAARLTDLRDKDALELALATATFEMTSASCVILWSSSRRDGALVLRERIRFLRASAGVQAGLIPGRSVEGGSIEGLAREAYAELRACHAARRSRRLPPDASGLYCHVFPISNGREVFSLLEIQGAQALPDEGERLIAGVLRIYCNQVGILDYSDRDELTGLLNRRTFDESFKALTTARPPPLSPHAMTFTGRRQSLDNAGQSHLAVIDIDFFKRINDQFGHPYGDEVLMLMARLMGKIFGESDLLFRFGGEEFLVILPGADAAGAQATLERLRGAVEAFAFPQVGRVTISLGMTVLIPGDTGSNAFGRADEALYVAKHEGRNQLRSYETLVRDGVLTVRGQDDSNVEMF